MKFSCLVFGLFYLGVGFAADSLIDVNNYRALTSDRRAFRVGEPLVIAVIESTTAESTAGTGSKSNVAVQASAYDNIAEQKAGLGLTGQADGAGQTSRKGRAFTQLSARIVEILPSGIFRIEGEQNLVINGENQKVKISGVVRAEDVSKDNTILSNRIADAQIEILGDGDVSDAQRRSIIFKVLQWLRII